MATRRPPGHLLVLAGLFAAVAAAGVWLGWGRSAEPPERRLRLAGRSDDDEFGAGIAGCGDLDGDGRADLVIGALFDRTGGEEAGRVLVVSGHDGAPLWDVTATEPGRRLGYGVAGAGDVNGDGTPDVIAGAARWGTGGAACVYSGKDGALLRTLRGDVPGGQFGHAVAAAGDVDGDGVADVVVGAPGTWEANAIGSAWVFSGSDGRTLHTLRGEGFAGDRFGFDVASAGDVNGDGRADVLVGSLGDTTNGPASGAVWVFSGADGALLRRLHGDREGDQLGHSVALVADLDGDGLRDLFAGAFRLRGRGYARVYSAADGEVLHEFTADADGDAFGHSVAGAGDVDGDGVGDLVVGAPDADVDGREEAGLARVYSGRDGRVLRTFLGMREKGHYGYVVAGAGDVNGDRLDDVALGTSIYDGDPGFADVVSVCLVEPFGDTPQAAGVSVTFEKRTTGGAVTTGVRVRGGRAGAAGVLAAFADEGGLERVLGEAAETIRFTCGADGRAFVPLALKTERHAGRLLYWYAFLPVSGTGPAQAAARGLRVLHAP